MWTKVAFFALFVMVLPGLSRAEPCHKPDAARARHLFEQARAHQDDGFMIEAIRAYRAALACWDDPRIHINLGILLSHTEQVIPAFESLHLGLRDGRDLLSTSVTRNALRVYEQLRLQIGAVHVNCEDTTTLILDGKPLCRSFDEVSRRDRIRWVTPGSHILRMRKPGYVSVTQHLSVFGGESVYVVPDLPKIPPRPPALPTFLFMMGGLIGLTGGALQVTASRSSNMSESIRRACPAETGCVGPMLQSFLHHQSRSRSYGQAARVSLVAAGVATVTALVLFALHESPSESITRPETEKDNLTRQPIEFARKGTDVESTALSDN